MKNFLIKTNYNIINLFLLKKNINYNIINTNKINNYIINILYFIKFSYKIKKMIKLKSLEFNKNVELKKVNSYKNILLQLKSKKEKIIDLLYFLKYFLIFRKYFKKLSYLSTVQTDLSKKDLFLKDIKSKKIFDYFIYKKNKRKYLNIAYIDFFFTQNTRFSQLPKLYDIRKKYIKYLNNNRKIYSYFKYRTKYNYNFIKRHIKTISILDIKSRVHKYEFSLRNIAIKLKFAYTFRTADIFIKSGFIFLNGFQTLNPKQFLYKGDSVELIFSKFLFKFKKKIDKKIDKSMRLFKKYSWKHSNNIEEKKNSLFRFSEKTFNFNIKLTKIFQFDYRTMSFFIINDINPKKDISFLTKKILPLYLLKLLNWKLIS